MKDITKKNNSKSPKLFENSDFGKIRVIEVDNEPWFVVNDVCAILEISNARDSISNFDHEDRGVSVIATPFGNQKMNVINESGLYTLIFRSRKEMALNFQKWVTKEVLPELRKSGSYSMKNKDQIESVVSLKQTMEEMKNEIANLQELFCVEDNLCLENDRQRFVALINRYSCKSGVNYGQGWKEFTKFYNNAFHTNLTRLIRTHEKKSGGKKITTPEYLEITCRIPDALRVAEKMIYEL